MGASVGALLIVSFVNVGGDTDGIFVWYLFRPLSLPCTGIVWRIANISLSTTTLGAREARFVAVYTV